MKPGKTQIIQETSRFFHERGMEPNINIKEGYLDISIPKNCTTKKFNMVLNDLRLHLEAVFKQN